MLYIMQRLEHTPIWWEQRGGRVVLFRKLRLAMVYRLAFALSVLSSISCIIAPVYLLGAEDATDRMRPVMLMLGCAAGSGLLAFVMYLLIRRDPHLFVRRTSLRMGQGLQLIATLEDVTLPTGMGGTMLGGKRGWIEVQPRDGGPLRRLVRSTADPDLHTINSVLARKGG